jgi:AraC-like DNA-binding protein
MGYAERRVAPGVEVWTSSGGSGDQRILPDGCLDLVWDGDRILVAGPDPTARVLTGARGPAVGVRLHGGRGPALLGLPADRLTGRTAWLADLWGDRPARQFTERVAGSPVSALGELAARVEVDPFGDRLLAVLDAGHDVAAAAGQLGWSHRQLQRRTRAAFGYGPQHLARVLRMQRAVAAGDRHGSWAVAAACAGYADQAHLTRDLRALAGVTPTVLRAERVRSVQDGA